MNEQGFRAFLKKEGRAENVIRKVLILVREFERYLHESRGGKNLDRAEPKELEAFVEQIESVPKSSAKTHLWGIWHYYAYTSNDEMRTVAGALRQARIERAPFPLADFRGVNPEHVERLAAVGIRNVKQMLKAGRTRLERQALAGKAGIPAQAVEEFVRLSDLARIPGVKGIRARLYYDAGVDTLEKMAKWDSESLRKMLVEFVERTGFDGIAPLPKEAAFSVDQAKKLPRIVEYS